MVRKALTLFSLLVFLNFTLCCATNAITTVPREGIPALKADSLAEYPREIVQTNPVASLPPSTTPIAVGNILK